MSWEAGVTSVKRCVETRAHYAHEWYNPLRQQCPGGPGENVVEAGRCGATGPTIVLGDGSSPPQHCCLPHGHGGWHSSDQGTEWTALAGDLLDPTYHEAKRMDEDQP
jgi:hypothetical protein